jgi:hypothetical protein
MKKSDFLEHRQTELDRLARRTTGDRMFNTPEELEAAEEPKLLLGPGAY